MLRVRIRGLRLPGWRTAETPHQPQMVNRGPLEATLKPREDILTALEAFPEEFGRVAISGRELETLRQPGSDGGWGVVEVLCHLADWDEIYLERARRFIDEEKPYLPGYDDELWPIERNYRGQNPLQVFARFLELRQEHVDFLRSLSPEQWERTGEHGYFGDITLHFLENHVYEHDQEHLSQARDVVSL